MTDATIPELSPLGLSILELLDERPMHPYELAATMRDRHHDEFIRLNFGSLYHTVDALERSGWILPVEREKEGGRPERTIYRLTDSGRDVLLAVVSEILAQPRREYLHFSAGLMFMHHLTPEVAAEQLTQRSLALGAVAAKLRFILDELHRSGHTRLTVIELEHKIAMIEAERKWVAGLAKEVADGKLEWKAGIGAVRADRVERRLRRHERLNERLRRRNGSGAH